MKNLEKYKGVIPAFYACYNAAGEVDTAVAKTFARWLVERGVKGLYLTGSSGECIYQTLDERKQLVEAVMEEVKGETTIIVHVGGVGTRDACLLAQHAEKLGADAIASIPPIYFRLPDHSIADYWNEISNAAPNTDFFIYNIPQLAGVNLTAPLLKEMLKNPHLCGVKNSSMPVQDIELFKHLGGEDFIVFNGPDEQYVAGRVIGADGGIGGTYGVMPQLFIAIDKALAKGDIAKARNIQCTINRIIEKLVSGHGHLYAMLKRVLKYQGIDIGTARAPMANITESDEIIAKEICVIIENATKQFV